MPFFPQFSNIFVPPYVPIPDSRLVIWLKADAGVVLSDGVVSEWQDQSGNGYHATEASLRPSVLTAEKNGLDVLDFSENCILTSSYPQTVFTEQTFFCVFKYISSAASDYARIISQFNVLDGESYSEYDYGLTNNYIPFARNTSDDVYSFAGGDWRINQAITDGNWYIAVGKHDGSTVSLSVNGAEFVSYSTTLNTTLSYMRICGSNVNGPNDFFNGQIAEIKFYSVALNQVEIDDIVSNLNAKWNVY